MCEAKPSPRDAGRIFYDGREAWTVIVTPYGPLWKRAPEMDAKLHIGVEEAPRGILSNSHSQTNIEAMKKAAESESTQEN